MAARPDQLSNLKPTAKAQTGRLRLGAWDALTVDYNPDDVGLAEYKQAIRRSATARFAYRFGRGNVARRLGEYTNDETAVEEWVRENVMPAVECAAKQLLSAWYYGVMLAEPVWDTSTGDLTLKRIRVTDPENFWGGEPVRDKATREIIGWRGITGDPVKFFGRTGIREVIHWSFDSEFDNAWGDPVARRLYPHYFRLSNLLKWEAVGAEVSALRRIIVHSNGDESGNQAVCDALGQLGTNGAVTVPPEVTSVQELSGGFSGGSPYSEPLERDVVGIFASFYMPPLMLKEAQFGTRAQATTQLEAWLGVETEIAEELADDVIVAQIIRPAIDMQFGPNAATGELAIRDPSPPDRAQWASIVQALTTTGYLDPTSQEHIEWVGELFEIPMEERERNSDSLPLLDRQQAQREQQLQQAQQNGKGKPEQVPTAEGRVK